MTKYTFSLNDINKTSNTCPFYNKCNNSINYSKVLDDLIAADIKEKNPWLYSTSSSYNTGNTIKIKINSANDTNDLENAFLFGDKYKTTYTFDDAYDFFINLATKCPFEKYKEYKLSNGDIIEITDDYIHINEKMYFFNLMNNAFFYNLSKKMKKTIATIYVDGLKITIKK